MKPHILAKVIFALTSTTIFSTTIANADWTYVEEKSDFTKDKTYHIFKEDASSAFAIQCKFKSKNKIYFTKVIVVFDLFWERDISPIKGWDEQGKIFIDGKAPKDIKLMRAFDGKGLAYETTIPGFSLEPILTAKDKISVAAVSKVGVFYEKKYDVKGLAEAVRRMPSKCIFDTTGYEFKF